jgi:hypothetical protein
MRNMDQARVEELLRDQEGLGRLIEEKLTELREAEPTEPRATEALDRLEQRLGEAKRALSRR